MCALCVTGWQWDDPEGLLVWNQDAKLWGLTVPGTDEGHPLTREALADMLPQTVSAETAAGAQTVPLAWEFGQFPERDAYLGVYTLTAALEGDFVLTSAAPALEASLILGDGEMYEQPAFNVALNEWVWEGFDEGATATILVNTDDIHSVSDLIAKLNSILPQRIYGWTVGANKTYDDGAFTYVKQETINVGANGDPKICSWGYLDVDWSNLEDQITSLTDWTHDFTIKAPLPTFPDRLYFVNDGNDTGSRVDLPIIIHSTSYTKDHTVTPAAPENVTVNLFDYWVTTQTPTETTNGDILNKSDNHFHEDGGGKDGKPVEESTFPTKYSSTDDWNQGINQGHLLLFGDGLIHAGLWNKGAGENCRYGRTYAGMEGIVKNVLKDGFPEVNLSMANKILTDDNSRNYELIKDYKLAGDHKNDTKNDPYGNPGYTYASTDIQNLSKNLISLWEKATSQTITDESATESLDYLFNPKTSHPNKKSYLDVNGLFQLDDEGYYFYNMRKNFAEFDGAEGENGGKNRFILYDAPATERTDHGENPDSIGNFFPFNKGSEVFNGIDEQGKLTSSVYCANNTMNHHLGMTVDIEFRQPANGKVNTGSGSKPMTFGFSGDDDVWVFIDDVLVLDMGGVHSEVYGTIDFETGDVYIGRAFGVNGVPENPADPSIMVTHTNLKALYTAAGMADTVKWAEGKTTFTSNTSHTLKMFYLERGNYDSSIALRFNLQPLLHQRIIKVDQYGKPIEGVTFDLYGASTKETTTAPFSAFTPTPIPTTNSPSMSSRPMSTWWTSQRIRTAPPCL